MYLTVFQFNMNWGRGSQPLNDTNHTTWGVNETQYKDQVLSLTIHSFTVGSFCTSALVPVLFNPLPNDKTLDETKFKAYADDKFIVSRMMISLLDRVENTVGKGENAGNQHFLLFPQCFPKPPSLGSLKVGIVW